jgi:hypothetical protein
VLFFSDDDVGEIATTTNMYAAGKIQKVSPLTAYTILVLVQGCFVRRNEGILWCNTEYGSQFKG